MIRRLALVALIVAAAVYLLRRGAQPAATPDAVTTHDPGDDDAETTLDATLAGNAPDPATGGGLDNSASVQLYPHPADIDSTAGYGDTEAYAETEAG